MICPALKMVSLKKTENTRKQELRVKMINVELRPLIHVRCNENRFLARPKKYVLYHCKKHVLSFWSVIANNFELLVEKDYTTILSFITTLTTKKMLGQSPMHPAPRDYTWSIEVLFILPAKCASRAEDCGLTPSEVVRH